MADATPPAPLRWGADPPAVPGWYWRRDDEGLVWMARVYPLPGFPGRLMVDGGVKFFGCLRWFAGGEWAGPVPEPGE